MLLVVCVTLCVHPPVFAAQTGHHTEPAHLGGKCGIERMHIHIIDKPVEIFLVFRYIMSGPRTAVHPRFLRCVLVREASVVSRFQLKVLHYLVLIVQLGLPRTVVDEHRTILVHILRRAGRVDICRAVLIIAVVVALPLAKRQVEVELVSLTESVGIPHLGMIHTHISVRRVAAEHQSRVCRSAHRTVMIRDDALVVTLALHGHSRERQVILAGEVPCQAGTGK